MFSSINLYTRSGINYSLSNKFKNIPIFISKLKNDNMSLKDLEKFLNDFSLYNEKWDIIENYNNEITFKSIDCFKNIHYLVLTK